MTDTERVTTGALSDDGSQELLEELLEDTLEPSVATLERWQRQTPSNHTVSLTARADGEFLDVRSPDGTLHLRVTIDAVSVQVQIVADEVRLRANDRLRLESRRLELAASEELRLESDGKIRQIARANVESTAFEHEFESTHGEIRLTANDDVALDGERIRLNSPRRASPTSNTSD